MKALRLIVVLLLVAVGVRVLIVWGRTPHSPEAALAAFQALNADDVGEEQLMDPLLLVGRGVVPLLLDAIPKREMPRRRYAIAALGHLRDVRALDVLDRLALDSTETEYIRCDALEASALIDRKVARALAEQMGPRAGCARTRALVMSETDLVHRTFLTIVLGDFAELLPKT